MKGIQNMESGLSRSYNFQDIAPEIVQLAVNYASDYLDYVDNLPFDLQRNVTRLREVDQKCRGYVKEIEQLYENFKKESATGNKTRRSNLIQIKRLFGLCKELGDEKISIVQSISEVIESRNRQMEYGRKRFTYAYEPESKREHDSKKDKEKLESSRGTKRSRRQRNNNSSENKEKIVHREQDKLSKPVLYDDTDEPPPKVVVSSSSPDHQTSVPTAVPALTRAALRVEDKRAASRSKEKEESKLEKENDQQVTPTIQGKASSDSAMTVSTNATSSTISTSTSSNKGKNSISTSSTTTVKANTKGKKKKRKSNRHQTERQASNSDDISPMIDLPIDPDEPTYCLCQQVSFGQMIGCDNPKCPIEWFHFSCVRLTHKPKGKWYCPDCTIKRKRECKRTDNR